jgi:glycosyltransferase involved in cell wall biosynthesis
MKIAIDALSAKSPYHGMGIYVSNLLKNIIPTEIMHNYVLYYKSDSILNQNVINDNRLILKKIRLPRSIRVTWELTLLASSLKQEKVDIFWGACNFLPPRKVCKYIVTLHDLSSFTFAKSYPLVRRLYYQYLISNATRQADYIVTVSQSTKQDLIKLFSVPETKIKVIYNGVDEIFQPITSADRLTQIKEKYRLPEKFIFTIGVMEPKKNTEGIIHAYAELKNRPVSYNLQSHKLVIGGSRRYGWKNSKIFQLIQSLNLWDDIVFTDFIEHEDLPAVYNLASVFVFPSFYEGFGLPVIEAMACGTPVITSNISSLPEIACDAAVLVNPYDTAEIANKIQEILNDENKRRQMIDQGLINAKRFSWEFASEQILKLFDEVFER